MLEFILFWTPTFILKWAALRTFRYQASWLDHFCNLLMEQLHDRGYFWRSDKGWVQDWGGPWE